MKPAAALLLAAVLAAPAWCGEAENPLKAAGPVASATPRLAALPSSPGPHVARIQAMGDNSWLDLGSPEPDPKWGKARGRAWTPRMPYAASLRAAFLCGCGQHGFVKPDGHFQDDLWAYDINAHRWICAYGGADVKTLRLHLDGHGFEVNDKNEHIPVSFMGHGYCNQAWIDHAGCLMLIFTHSPWWTKAMPQRWDWLDQNFDEVKRRNYGHAGPVIENPKHPLFYDVAAGRWERKFVAGDGPGDRRSESVLEYLPERRQAFYLYHGKVWLYDFAAEKWTPSAAERVNVEYDSWGCYDAKRRRVYVARKEMFLAYDVDAGKWSAIKGRDQPENLGSCTDGAITYDVAGDAVLIHLKDGSGIRIYDPEKNAWTTAAPAPGAGLRRFTMNGFYDPVLNAHYYHLAGDSRDDGVMLVYRYKQASAAPKPVGQ